MKYKVNQKVKWAGRKCVVVGTKEEPYKPEVDPYNRKEIYPEKGYILLLLKEVKGGVENYLGCVDVYESEIDPIEW